MNVVLVGYRGSGKTSVGEVVAERAGREFLSTDAILVEQVGMSIPAFVEKKGWDAFRDVEEAICREAASREDVVIDCGGGIVVRRANVENLRRTGRVYWLRASVETIRRRLEGASDRPSLTGNASFLDEVRKVLAEREPLCRAAAHVTLDTDDRGVEEIAELILRDLERA
jgi:shikimate kinase